MSSTIYYTIIDNFGNIVYSQISTNPNYPVQEGQRLVKDEVPIFDTQTQIITRITPIPEGQDFVEYKISERIITEEELINDAIGKRLSLLVDSDWTHLLDSPLSDSEKSSWKKYRQDLRDITEQPGYPKNIIWPIKPE